MRYGIYLTFDAHTEQSIKRLQNKLKGVPKMAPHLTLLVFDDANNEGVLKKFKEFIHDFETFSIRLKKVNSFSRRHTVLYLEPVSSRALKEAYLRCLDGFASSCIISRYRTLAQWHPHITLAKNMSSSELHEVKAMVEEERTPLKVTVCGIGLINIQKPLEVLASKALTPREPIV
jgi:2'-5' RNA ligase